MHAPLSSPAAGLLAYRGSGHPRPGAGLALMTALLLAAAPALAQGAVQHATAPEHPLSIQVGAFEFTPGGFLNLTAFYRSTDVGSGLGTHAAAIPFASSIAGRVSEIRETAQPSRLSLKISGRHQGTPIYAYIETDFLGHDDGGVTVQTNGNSLRMRLFFVDLRHGRWELVAGQAWSLITPNRLGLSPEPSHVFHVYNQIGLPSGRQPQIRLIDHVSRRVTAGVSAENPEQYIGGGRGSPLATLPGGPGGPYGGQVNNGNSSFADPGFAPDVIGKLAYDSRPDGQGLHLEAAGLASAFRIFTPASVNNPGSRTDHAYGAGYALDVNAPVFDHVRLVGNFFWGDGGGRYLDAVAPDFIIRQNGEISPVRSFGGVIGFEAPLTRRDLLFGYYTGDYIYKNFDLSGAAPVGYGYPGSPDSINKDVQQFSLGLSRTLWKANGYGSMQVVTDYTYITRNPYYAATAENAHLGMASLSIRYVIP